MSPRRRGETYKQLHDQAAQKRVNQEKAIALHQQEVWNNANKSLLENVNEKSDATLVKSFWDEYQVLMRSYKQLYLADALEDLHFFEMS